RRASDFLPVAGVAAELLADRAQLASLADETPEGRSIVVLAKTKFGIRAREVGGEHDGHRDVTFIPFSASTRMSGVDADGYQVRKGAGDAVLAWVRQQGGNTPADLETTIQRIALEGGTPLVVAERGKGASADGEARVLGVVYLKDIVKGGIRERFDRLGAMGIRTVMITGDNPLTAAAIAKEAGVDDFLAEAKPE